MPADKVVAPPSFDAILLPELQAGDADDLEPAASLDAFGFDGLTLETLALGGARIEASRLAGVRAAEADLRGTTISEAIVEQLDVPVVRAARTRWRDVRFEGGRLGSAELYEAEWRSVHFVGCKLGFVKLRGSELRDVQFTDCVVDELDLASTEALRLAFPGTRIRRFDVSRATLRDVDLRGCDIEELAGVASLRGAVVDSAQLMLLAPLLASEAGIRVVD